MKELGLIFLISINLNLAFSQFREDFCINFEQQQLMDHLWIDTVNYPDNIWQVGPPQKMIFDAAYSLPNAIVTDTINPYPADNNSAFIIKTLAEGGFIFGLEFFQGAYRVQSDSLADFGTIEFSPDQGMTWIDMINDTAYNMTFYWGNSRPVLTGNSGGWKFFEAMMMDLGSVFNIQFGDTLLFRFTFTSETNDDNFDGLMFDDICMYEMIEGITETRFKPLKTSIFPNPSSGHFTIDFDNKHGDVFQLDVYDTESKLVLNKDKISGTQLAFNAIGFAPGIYYYKLTSCNRNQRGWGKFIVAE